MALQLKYLNLNQAIDSLYHALNSLVSKYGKQSYPHIFVPTFTFALLLKIDNIQKEQSCCIKNKYVHIMLTYSKQKWIE